VHLDIHYIVQFEESQPEHSYKRKCSEELKTITRTVGARQGKCSPHPACTALVFLGGCGSSALLGRRVALPDFRAPRIDKMGMNLPCNFQERTDYTLQYANKKPFPDSCHWFGLTIPALKLSAQ
jgi:hypothetical protein